MKTKQQSGFISLMMTIIISLLLVAITVSMLVLSLGEQRQAQDADQSIKAFYAAQSAEEYLLYQLTIGHANLYPQCNSALTNGQGLQTFPVPRISITCERILLTENNVSGSMSKDEATEVSPGAGSGFDHFNVYWNGANQGVRGIPSSTCNLNSWSATNPVPLEMVIVDYNAGNPADVASKTTVLCPVAGPTATPLLGLSGAIPSLVNADCAGALSYEGFQCRATFTNPSAGRSYLLRIRPRFAGTDYKIDFRTSSDALVDVPTGFATIDVTGRGGDAYRRIIRRVQLKRGAVAGLDYVLYSDDQICKNFTVAGNSLISPAICQ